MSDRLILKVDTVYQVIENYHREVSPLVYDLKKGELVKLEKTFGGLVRVIKQKPDEGGTYKHRLVIMPIKEARKILTYK